MQTSDTAINTDRDEELMLVPSSTLAQSSVCKCNRTAAAAFITSVPSQAMRRSCLTSTSTTTTSTKTILKCSGSTCADSLPSRVITLMIFMLDPQLFGVFLLIKRTCCSYTTFFILVCGIFFLKLPYFWKDPVARRVLSCESNKTTMAM